jgi:hypothetical protein
MAFLAEMLPIDVDALLIEQDGIPDSGRSVSLSVNMEKLN